MYHNVLWWTEAILLLLLSYSAQAQISFGSCYGGTSYCCTDLNFSLLPGYNNASGQLRQGRLVGAETYAALGVNISLDAKTVRPNSEPPELFPIGLLNTSTIGTGETWATLRSPRDGLVLTVLDTLVPLRPLRSSGTVANPYSIRFAFSSVAKNALACVASVRALRTYDTAYRMSMQVTAYAEDGSALGTREARWTPTLVSSRNNEIELDVSIPEVAAIDVTWVGAGYGAVSSVRFCYPNTVADACGVCGGDGSVCGIPATVGPKPGLACVNNSMPEPECRPGRYDTHLKCVPNLFNVTREVCDGHDNDCDGVIDNGAEALPVSCGVGACARTVYRCGYDGEPFNVTCVPGTPTPEVCDGIDNDCDGVVDNGHVCDRPVEGVPVVPLRVCVSGRLARPRTRCFARFGYFARDPYFDVTLPYPSDVNSLIFSPSTPALWTPSNDSTLPPSNFTAASQSLNAFEVELPACSGIAGKVTWQLGDGRGNYQRAELDADTAPPCETSNYTTGATLELAIRPMVDEPCVRRTAGGICAVKLGYYNPNLNVPFAYIEVGPPLNYFYFTGGANGANNNKTAVEGMVAPPNDFTPGRVRGAYEASWLCPHGTEMLHWLIKSGALNETKEAFATRLCK